MSLWIGTYTDPIYGGYINVCVSQIGGEFYGQGVMSEVGYLRGKIIGNHWSGMYALAGQEVNYGSFSLMLTGTSYAGSFTQAPGYTYDTSGLQLSSTSPSDLACMRTDDDYLLLTTNDINFTGEYISVDEYQYDQLQYDDGTMVTYSYRGTETNTDGTGFGNHPQSFFYDQVSVGNWYASGLGGIEMFVLKNATTTYMNWWTFDQLSQFNYSAQVDDSVLHKMQYIFKIPDVPVTSSESISGACEMQPTAQAMANCEGSSTTSHDLSDGQIAGIALGVFFALIIGCGIGYMMSLMIKTKSSLASKDQNIQL